jgi:hypothetical protein
MRKLREILRLRLQAELSLRQIKGSLRLSLGAIQKVASRAHELELDWSAIDVLDDQQLAKLIYSASDLQHITPNPVDVTKTNSQQTKNLKEKECIYFINISVRNVPNAASHDVIFSVSFGENRPKNGHFRGDCRPETN